MSLVKPYFRIIRPRLDGSYAQHINNFYATDVEFASDRIQLICAFDLLVEDLRKIFSFIEPTDSNNTAYSHRNYELLLRACTEFETNCQAVLFANGCTVPVSGRYFTIRDYHKLNRAMHLSEYLILLNLWSPVPRIFAPLDEWDSGTSLSWYTDYNTVKHDRNKNFPQASLENVVKAVAGVFVILYAQFNFLTFNAQHKWGMLGKDDETDFEYDPGSLFAIKTPTSWLPDERYDFDWKTLKMSADPIAQYQF